MKALPLTLAVLLLLGSLAGCASDTEKYCSALKDDKAQLARLAASSDRPQRQVLRQSLTLFEELRAKAPHDVAGDWGDFVTAWRSVVAAFDSAGIDPARFTPDRKPAGVSTGQFQAIRQAAAELGSAPVQDAAARIQDHAQTVCKVDLGGAGLGGGGGGM